jgi:hypothetical protein
MDPETKDCGEGQRDGLVGSIPAHEKIAAPARPWSCVSLILVELPSPNHESSRSAVSAGIRLPYCQSSRSPLPTVVPRVTWCTMRGRCRYGRPSCAFARAGGGLGFPPQQRMGRRPSKAETRRGGSWTWCEASASSDRPITVADVDAWLRHGGTLRLRLPSRLPPRWCC